MMSCKMARGLRLVKLIQNTKLKRNICARDGLRQHQFIHPFPCRQVMYTRRFQTEASFHDTADNTLDIIQDKVEEFFEDNIVGDMLVPEVNVASGVLTLTMPPHGTWIVNKQTPNRQIWWSSPISGPRRYEWDVDYDVENNDDDIIGIDGGTWVYTRYIDENRTNIDARIVGKEDKSDRNKTLGGILRHEISDVYGVNFDL